MSGGEFVLLVVVLLIGWEVDAIHKTLRLCLETLKDIKELLGRSK